MTKKFFGIRMTFSLVFKSDLSIQTTVFSDMWQFGGKMDFEQILVSYTEHFW